MSEAVKVGCLKRGFFLPFFVSVFWRVFLGGYLCPCWRGGGCSIEIAPQDGTDSDVSSLTADIC